MFLLKRKISPYTHHDIIIGLFDSFEDASKNQDLYIKKCNREDKWEEQGYQEVDLKKDVIIDDVSNLIKNDTSKQLKAFHIVSLLEEGFGQITRKIDSIYISVNEANSYIEKKEQEEPEYEPSWYEIETIEINTPYFDK
ncbi:hypothetical protein [Aquimarina sp. 2201CG5-10]|uniref:hypothetical protein n=1 Tax=Aquimarina callyspongiae TaxID=3098150 RepID=UPI002AB39CE4|nr:hypothetical protein [Aquimarina sp. 2201CG5-10]MDY8134453.1 hypothetical protein [Aquimarina sp. 2201CG5-10]